MYFNKEFKNKYVVPELKMVKLSIITLWAKIKFVEVPQSENCIPLTYSSPLMGEKCPFIGSIGPFLESDLTKG